MLDQILNKTTEADIVKKPVCFFTVATVSHLQYAIPFFKSLTKFHSPKDIDMILYTDETRPEELQKLPEGIKIVSLTPFLEDEMFFYRQKPILMEPLLDQYDLVVGFDADQLVLGDLNAILEANDYDVGTVINYNRFDEKYFPLVEIGRIGIPPIGYYNCGTVAIRSKKFCHEWVINCFSQEFNYCQYKEQDILNIMTHFGNFNVRCFDMANGPEVKLNWFGIISKGELPRAEIKDDTVMVPKGFGSTPYPPADVQLRIVHMGGGAGSKKDNWSTFFSSEVMEHINKLIR
jgi:hypothetical protein